MSVFSPKTIPGKIKWFAYDRHAPSLFMFWQYIWNITTFNILNEQFKIKIQKCTTSLHAWKQGPVRIHLSHALFIDLKYYSRPTNDIPDYKDVFNLWIGFTSLYIYCINFKGYILSENVHIVWKILCIYDYLIETAKRVQ